MKSHHWVLALGFAILTALVIVDIGCVKGNPVGADVSTLANTTITVNVFEGTTAQAVTVQATDPSGNVTTQTTGSNGQTTFSAKTAGQWTVTVPTQGNFSQSTANVNVVAGTNGPSISFTSQGQQLILSPLTSETYGISGANISYQVTYNNYGNLAEPVSLVVAGPLTQTGWNTSFNYTVLGSTTNIAQLNVIIPQGSYQQPTFTIQAYRLNGTYFFSSGSRAINKNYAMATNFYVSSIIPGTASVTYYSSSATTVIAPTTIIGNISLSTVNAGDSSTPWLVSFAVSGLNLSGSVTSIYYPLGSGLCGPATTVFSPAFNGQFSSSDGIFNSGNTDSFQFFTGNLKPITILTPFCYFNGAEGSSGICSTTIAMSPQSVNLNMSLTSAVGSSQGAVTNINFCSVGVGSVFTLTH